MIINTSKIQTILSIAACLGLLAVTACTPPASNVKQLTEDVFSCQELPQAQIDANLVNFSNDAVKGDLRQDLQGVRNVLAQMPDQHIADLNEQVSLHGFQISYLDAVPQQQRSPDLLAVHASPYGQGYTQYYISQYGDTNCISTYIKDSRVIDWLLMHELGHCMESLQQNKFPQEFNLLSRDRVQEIYEEGLNRKDQLLQVNPPVRPYAFESKHELFAESYQNYYCSPEANQYLDRTFPLMHDLMQEKFEAPRWETDPIEGESSTTTLANTSSEISLKMDNLAVSGSQHTNFLEVGVPSAINQVRLCYGDQQKCLTSQAADLEISLLRSGARNVFRTPKTFNVQTGSALTILGYDQANPSEPSILRSVNFKVN